MLRQEGAALGCGVEPGCGSGPMVLPGNAGAEKAPNQGLGTHGTKWGFLVCFS